MRTLVSLLLLVLTCSVHAQKSDSVMYTPGFSFEQGIYLNYAQFMANAPVPKSAIVLNEYSTRLDYIKLALSKEWIQWRDTSGKIQTMKSSSVWGYSENNGVYIRYNYNFNRIVVIGSICHFTAYETNYMYTGPGTYPSQQYGTPVESLEQFVLDTKTGQVLAYNLANMEMLLRRDAVLFAEFDALKKRQKKDQMFIYLRKYNEKHPLYFIK